MKPVICLFFSLIFYSFLHAQIFIDEELRTIRGLDQDLAFNNNIHFQTIYELEKKRKNTDTSLIWRKEYNQKGSLISYNIKESQYCRKFDTLNRLSDESYIWNGVLQYRKSFFYRNSNDTLIVELVKSVEKPIYTTIYYYYPENKLIYKTIVDSAGRKQRVNYLYNEKGLLLQVVFEAYGNSTKLIEYYYESVDNPVKIIHYSEVGDTDFIEYNKFENNNCIERDQINFFMSKSRYKEVNSYDDKNNLVEQITYLFGKFFSHTKYFYNSENLIIREESYDKKDRLETIYIFYYEYW